jgi:hypothetical protein
MSCCGKQRGSLYQQTRKSAAPTARAPYAARGAANSPPQRPTEAASAPILLQYVGNADVVVHGPVTKRSYAFSRGASVQPIDPRDAVVLLRDKRFGLS